MSTTAYLKFEIDWRTNFGEDHIFWEILPKALRALVNLKTLQFRTTGGGPIEGLLDGCTFQLEDLHWHCHSDELKIQSFLPTQRGLRRLSLGGWDDTRFSAPSSNAGQPDFRELAGSYGVVHAFLPGREITRLRWVPDLDDPWDTSTGLDIEGLATSLEKLKYLSFGGYFTRPHLCSISDHLSSLFYLELMGYDRQEDESVCSLPSLKWLRISIRWGLSQSSISDPQERTVQMFTCSKSLQTIEVQEEAKFDNHGNKIHSYNRWDRNLGLVRKFDEQTEMWPEVF
ncbi:hypothetical protein D9757_003534 [Collybiopsis confluens]|uniref:Uncharacterized protein n=1 Tax=Collybiopsis confluens TaxID=2823264 RepID=A0A8H5MD63_9AGAR|nr:hypothetical protein D9757_003534 [Collybiopsis confluens]